MLSGAHPATADLLYFDPQPTNTLTGTIDSISVFALLPTNHRIDSQNDSAVTLSTASGPGALLGVVTVQMVNGIANFGNYTETKPGVYRIQALDANDAGTVSHQFTATGGHTILFFTQGATDILAGQTIPAMQVTEFDGNGNLMSNDNSTVIWLKTISGPTQPIGGLQVIVYHGVATFSVVSLQTEGYYILFASAPANPYSQATETGLQVSPGAPSVMVFARQPSNTTVGHAINPPAVVYLEDAYGNIIRDDTSTATMIVAAGPSTLMGTTSVNFNNGAAIFSNLFVNEAGAYSLIVNDGSFGAPTSVDFTVT